MAMLYHATYEDRMHSILTNGLLPNQKKNWKGMDMNNKLYLAFDPCVAEYFVKSSDFYNNKKICILEIDTKDLDLNCIDYDWNVRCTNENEIVTCTYDKPIYRFKYVKESHVRYDNTCNIFELQQIDVDGKQIADYLLDYFEENVEY